MAGSRVQVGEIVGLSYLRENPPEIVGRVVLLNLRNVRTDREFTLRIVCEGFTPLGLGDRIMYREALGMAYHLVGNDAYRLWVQSTF